MDYDQAALQELLELLRARYHEKITEIERLGVKDSMIHQLSGVTVRQLAALLDSVEIAVS